MTQPNHSSDEPEENMTFLARLVLPLMPIHSDFKEKVRRQSRKRKVIVIDALFPTYTCVQLFVALLAIFSCFLIRLLLEAIGIV